MSASASEDKVLHPHKDAELGEKLNLPIEELDLCFRVYITLRNANVLTVGCLVQKTEMDILRTKNLGDKSLREIKEVLESIGLCLGMVPDSHGRLGKPADYVPCVPQDNSADDFF
jgi:DNA-directed RNA polymerase alpha subunit